MGYLAACITGQVTQKFSLGKLVPATTPLSAIVEPTKRALDLVNGLPLTCNTRKSVR
jgi:hypothetical protein